MHRIIFAIAAALSVLQAAHAAPVTYDFSWTGTGGYAMSGNFSFDSASAADGVINGGEVTSLFFEGFLNGVSIGSNAIAPTQGGFNFNFDAVAGQFFLNGESFGAAGQRWNFTQSGLGFGAGSAGSALTNPAFLGFVGNPAPLVATLAGSVPEPGSLALAALSLAALGATNRRRAVRHAMAA